MRSFLLLACVSLLPWLAPAAFAQPTTAPAAGAEQNVSTSASPAVRPIPNSDIMYQKTLWRRIDLREKQNRPMFSANHQISKIILDAVKRGELPSYKNDSLTSTLTVDEFKKKLLVPGASVEKDTLADDQGGGGGDWGDAGGGAATASAEPVAAEFFPQQIYTLDLKERMIFDKKRSRMYHQIESMSLVIPASQNEAGGGIEIPIGTFKYADLVKVFRANPESAIWFNARNDAQHRNLADAFELWLFSSYITKVSNPDDTMLSDSEGSGQRALFAAQQTAADLIEYEYNLWSF